MQEMTQIPWNIQTMHATKLKEMVLKSLNPWRIINDMLAYVTTYFGQAKNYVGQVKIINYLSGLVT